MTKSTKIKIAYVIDRLDTGGTERQLKYLIDGLNPKKFEVDLYLLRGDKDHPFRPQNADVQVLGVNSLLSINGFRKFFWFSRHLKKNHYHIIQTFFQDSTVFGVMAAKLAGVPKVLVSVRDMRFWASPVSSIVHKTITSLADAILVNSNAVRDHMKPLVRSKPVHTIYNGIPIGSHYKRNANAKKALAAEIGIDRNLPFVVLVSNCNREVKRVDLLIESIPIVLEKAKAFFLVVGDGHLRPALEKRSRELEIQTYIRFLGQRHDVEKILAGSDIALNTSETEGLSNAILEAMRAGLPVVASDVEGNRELVKSGVNGLLFSSGNSEELAKQILKPLKNRTFSATMGEASSKFIRSKFSLSQMVSNYVEFIEYLLNHEPDGLSDSLNGYMVK